MTKLQWLKHFPPNASTMLSLYLVKLVTFDVILVLLVFSGEDNNSWTVIGTFLIIYCANHYCCHLSPPSPLSSVTQPKSWYSFYSSPTESGRLSTYLGTTVRECNPCPRLFNNRNGCRDKELPAVRFEPGSPHTAVMHSTIRPLRPGSKEPTYTIWSCSD